ncbi:MAG: hypothetical protein LBG80_00210 [Bacteroidales bacterium]|jgi:hypothetical protein|nr:hypothetical protein [Bacteroidales bacterium]
MEQNELEKAIEFVEINIMYRRDECIPNANGLWKKKYVDELKLFKFIRLVLLENLYNRKPNEQEISNFMFNKNKNE